MIGLHDLPPDREALATFVEDALAGRVALGQDRHVAPISELGSILEIGRHTEYDPIIRAAMTKIAVRAIGGQLPPDATIAVLALAQRWSTEELAQRMCAALRDTETRSNATAPDLPLDLLFSIALDHFFSPSIRAALLELSYRGDLKEFLPDLIVSVAKLAPASVPYILSKYRNSKPMSFDAESISLFDDELSIHDVYNICTSLTDRILLKEFYATYINESDVFTIHIKPDEGEGRSGAELAIGAFSLMSVRKDAEGREKTESHPLDLNDNMLEQIVAAQNSLRIHEDSVVAALHARFSALPN